ncbi:anti-anti-sigma regulatory factor (antagonist of anti-sigma factor) [Spongiibacter sp. IMCC21906]|jgi:anti-anti-sigma factor|uniref:STAS domain-containing protein n=1 Tax=Spongiibacter sp. IMCC21906 TaxID=1620392 RepID=UPI00062E05CD|nr:STAS domain-containing protein [Spongiibacter sp. IMCC21906]AKH69611.1 anti-anti-sigma regulatory factor (antagonist of anti-sigma factor) [Spongiibacter sp. IMCC21906]
MQPGKILVAEQDGAFVIKLVGDVRLTLCTTMDEFFDEMLAVKGFASVVVDLADAVNIDSTTLGLLAKLAIKAKQRFHYIPLVLSTNPDITRVLESMSFDRVFRIREVPLISDEDLGELPVLPDSEEGVKRRVLEAHRVLMGMSESNRAKFRELVTLLEGQCY